MQINIPEVVAEVNAAHDRYEAALMSNDADTLIELFWNNELTLRYGVNEILYGHAAIAEFRRNRPGGPGIARHVTKSVVTTYGRDFATTNLEYERKGFDTVGRQSQSWVRMPEGWRIVAAHVSHVVALE